MRQGREILTNGLRAQGYTLVKARQIVEDFLLILKRALGEGKRIPIEGLGILEVQERKPRMHISKHLKNVGPTIVTVYRRKKIIRLSKGQNMEPTE